MLAALAALLVQGKYVAAQAIRWLREQKGARRSERIALDVHI
jgi:hypothetical protein